MALVVAQETFATAYADQEVVIKIGDLLDADHPIVRNTPKDWWIPAEPRFGTVKETPVEEATAAPGAKRTAPPKAKRSE